MRNLVIDNGNTRVKSALFENGQLTQKWVDPTFEPDEIFTRATNHEVENVILSTVGTAPSASWEDKMNRSFHYRQLDTRTPLPVENRYATPETLGKDRLAAAIGAWAQYPGQHCLVVDAGTCLTLDLVTAEGSYLGGNISPGVRMRLRAMHAFTARLPQVDVGAYTALLGQSTESALQNGGLLGAVLEIEGLASRLSDSYPGLITVLTGGDAAILAERLKSKIFVHLNLVLEGLNKILEYNVELRA